MLQCVADKIRGVLKLGQMVARLGGDEFAVIVPGLPSAGYATRTAEAILDAFNDTGANLPAGVTIGTSIGIAVFPNDAPDRETLLTNRLCPPCRDRPLRLPALHRAGFRLEQRFAAPLMLVLESTWFGRRQTSHQ